MDTASVGELEQGMVGVHRLKAHGLGVEEALVSQRRGGLVAVHELDLLAQHNITKYGK